LVAVEVVPLDMLAVVAVVALYMQLLIQFQGVLEFKWVVVVQEVALVDPVEQAELIPDFFKVVKLHQALQD
jgi:hypothetical protein